MGAATSSYWSRDHSCSLPSQSTLSLHLNLTADFTRRILHGYVDLTLEISEPSDFIQLDCKNLAIERILCKSSFHSNDTDFSFGNMEDATEIPFTLPEYSAVFGHVLRMQIEKQFKGVLCVRIYYATTEQSAGIQWFNASQTADKKLPFMYTQGQAILARTIVPCQDVPSIKFPYSATITVPDEMVALCSGISKGEVVLLNKMKSYSYFQSQSIPAYLIAIVIGGLACGKIGPRSSVWAEPSLLEAAVSEFGSHTELFIQGGEKATGVSYDWGIFDVVVLPSAFPYGGMENPNITFLSASLLTGDKSLINVLCHEITHSWSGNYVTNSNWPDFWLNEGFTVYLERIILGHVYESENYRHFEILIGYNELVKTVEDLVDTPEFAKLRPNMDGIDPDDAFTKIPYEKGSLFLFFIEGLVEGASNMQGWLKTYFTDFRTKSLNTEDMRKHFESYFKEKFGKEKALSIFSQINWDEWLYSSKLPTFNPTTVCDKSYALKCEELSQLWKNTSPADVVQTDNFNILFASFNPKQVMYFLDILLAENFMTLEKLQDMDSLYKLSSSPNVEISFRWLMLNMQNDNKSILPSVSSFLSKHGRGLYVKPLFSQLNRLDHNLALQTYKANSDYYHVVIKSYCQKVLEN